MKTFSLKAVIAHSFSFAIIIAFFRKAILSSQLKNIPGDQDRLSVFLIDGLLKNIKFDDLILNK